MRKEKPTTAESDAALPPPAPAAETRAPDAWAEELGYLPQFLGGTSLGGMRPNPRYWKYPATKALMETMTVEQLKKAAPAVLEAWKAGQMTRPQFEGAFDEYDALRFGG